MILTVIAGTGAVILPPKLQRYFQALTLRRAQAYQREEDFRSAQLTLQGAVQANPLDFEARRMLAELYATTGSPLEFTTWQELLQLEPGNDRNRIGLAECAVRTRNLAVAREALAAVSPAGQGTADYFRAAAGVAMLAGDPGALEKALSQLARFEPEDEPSQFNLAALQLAGSDPTLVVAARARLVAWARGDTRRIRATLELIRDLARHKDPREIRLLAADILPSRVGLLNRVLDDPAAPDMFEVVEHMKRQPHPTAGDALALAGWMRTAGFAREALLWLATLDPVLAKTPPLLEERVRCALQLRDWRSLESLLRAGAWGSLSDEMLDLAFAARVQRESASLTGAETTWNDTLVLAGNSVQNLRARVRLAGAFGWPREMERALWQLVQVAPTETGAWQALAAAAENEDSADKLLAVLAAWAHASSADSPVRANHVLLATLLQRTNATTREAALDLVRLNPVPPAILAAQALELGRQGRVEAAARLVEPMAAASSPPRVALACGLVLAQAGRLELARPFLAAASRVRFLPAEEALLAEAQHRLSQTGSAFPPVLAGGVP